MSLPLNRTRAKKHNLEESLREFLEYWEAKCDGERLPSKEEMDPVDLRSLLNKVMLFEVIDGGFDFKIRICGHEIREILGVPVNGELLSDLEKDNIVVADTKAFEIIIKSRTALCETDRNMAAVGRPHVQFQSVVVPLSSDGVGIDFLMGAYDYGDKVT